MTEHDNGIGFLGMLAIVFITLKLLGSIDWSWWWVLAPLWLPPVGFLCALVVFVLCGVSIDWGMSILRRRRGPRP